LNHDIALAQIPIADISPAATNSRRSFDKNFMAELEQSVRDHGVLNPILVRIKSGPADEGRVTYEVVAGNQRFEAALRAGIETIPAQIRYLSDLEVAELQIIENLQRANINLMDEARAIAQLMLLGKYTGLEAAQRIGKPATYVYESVKLLDLSNEAQSSVERGELARSVALEVARVRRAEDQTTILKKAIEGEPWRPGPMTVRQVRDLIANKFDRDLTKLALFDTQNPCAARSACTKCPNRSANNPAMLETHEGDTNICGDLSCFDLKTNFALEELAKPHRAFGLQVFFGYDTPKGWASNDKSIKKAHGLASTPKSTGMLISPSAPLREVPLVKLSDLPRKQKLKGVATASNSAKPKGDEHQQIYNETAAIFAADWKTAFGKAIKKIGELTEKKSFKLLPLILTLALMSHRMATYGSIDEASELADLDPDITAAIRKLSIKGVSEFENIFSICTEFTPEQTLKLLVAVLWNCIEEDYPREDHSEYVIFNIAKTLEVALPTWFSAMNRTSAFPDREAAKALPEVQAKQTKKTKTDEKKSLIASETKAANGETITGKSETISELSNANA
jgi:ParB/RepB/Spo0J family partition protein